MNNPVPWLRSGLGERPEEGGCIMQVIDWISTGGWSDHPRCVHPKLEMYAIGINDWSTDDERQRLLDLVPRLMNTSGYYPTGTWWRQTAISLGVDPMLNCGCRECAGGQDPIDCLVRLLDAFDEHTGRTQTTEEIDYSALCELMPAA